tara:strand:+ start:1316 stop:1495 length:180 start_codon:yes stop_codon:yes gene_type:complete
MRHLTGAQPGEVDTVTAGHVHRAPVRRFALVPVASAGGINKEAFLCAMGLDDIAEHAFR